MRRTFKARLAMSRTSIVRKSLKVFVWLITAFFLFEILGAAFRLPLFIDRLCIDSEAPREADFIVCVGAGLTTGALPTDDGWGRIYSSVQLYLDGYGKKIIFTGGGSERISEAEVYAEAARWLGLADGDAMLDPGPNQTSEHPNNIRKISGLDISNMTPLNIVTSELHSKRTALCFKKAGYVNFRLVTSYRATGRRASGGILVSRPDASPFLRAEKTSALPSFHPSGKSYDDIFMKMRQRSWRFLTALRELAALAVYKLKGYI